ncbi:tyrosine recombinase XerC-like [Neodiprion virginianus]|uniref:tyrosine recombinase XerC-like n=1 Tax=Neodiprion virginianus TaxID=2961670 RepID=UPI001EE73083|nr:tyrosine recombinase XerC-like [Neodiprion virginianus]
MSDQEKHSSDEWLQCTPLKLREAAENTRDELLPTKSQKMYESTYDAFVKWKRAHKTKVTSESIVMAYFKELSEKYKSSTLWSMFSMLKATIKIKENTDIDQYHSLKAFMKKTSSGFVSKKSKVLSSENVEKFLTEAPDREYLTTKVALIFGISGACRSNELVNIRLRDVKKEGNLLVVNLPDTKTKRPRTFVISEEFVKIVQQYTDLRPQNAMTDRFFVNYQKGKCTCQVIGIHKFSKMPKEIAGYLKLEDSASFTGHAFRRTSATLLADSGANITTLKRHGGWKSSNVAEDYIEESVKNKSKIGHIISTAVNFAPAGPSERNNDDPPSKREKIETITSEKENLKTQTTVVDDENSPSKKKFVFNNCTNCTFVIHDK